MAVDHTNVDLLQEHVPDLSKTGNVPLEILAHFWRKSIDSEMLFPLKIKTQRVQLKAMINYSAAAAVGIFFLAAVGILIYGIYILAILSSENALGAFYTTTLFPINTEEIETSSRIFAANPG